MVSPAQVPSTPVSPDPLRIGMIGAVLGLVLGIRQAAVGFEHLDDRIRSRDDVERFIGTQPPVLAAIPRLRLHAGHEIVDGSSRPELEEVYRSLRTSVDFLSVEDPFGVTMVTSPNASEGKTVHDREPGCRHRPRRAACCPHRLRPAPGSRSRAVRPLQRRRADVRAPRNGRPRRGPAAGPGLPRLYVLTSGPLPPNPSELLSLERFGKVVSLLRANARVFLDTPAVLRSLIPSCSPPTPTARWSVARAELTTGGQLRRTVELLGRSSRRSPAWCSRLLHDREGDVPPSYLRKSEEHAEVGHPSRRRRVVPTATNGAHRPAAPSPTPKPTATNGAPTDQPLPAPPPSRLPRTGRTNQPLPAPPPSRLPRTGRTNQPLPAPPPSRLPRTGQRTNQPLQPHPQADRHERGKPTSRSQPHPQRHHRRRTTLTWEESTALDRASRAAARVPCRPRSVGRVRQALRAQRK